MTRNIVSVLATAWTLTILSSAEAQDTFVPTHAAVEGVALQSFDGMPLGNVEAGTPVRVMRETKGMVQLQLPSGNVGLAPSRAFLRYGSRLKMNDSMRRMAESVRRFSFDLYQQEARHGDNVCLSPISVAACLTMALVGARGATREEITRALHVEDARLLEDSWPELLEFLNSCGEQRGYLLQSDRRAWLQTGLVGEPRFANAIAALHGDVEFVDFTRPHNALREIDGWVSRRTRGAIENAIGERLVTPKTLFLLTDVLAFEGRWQNEFARTRTRRSEFHISADQKMPVDMMERDEKTYYYEDAEVQATSLPYRGGEISMVLVVPIQRFGLDAVEHNLSDQRFKRWLDGMQRVSVDARVPRFAFKSRTRLRESLVQLGVRSAFDRDSADFSPLARRNPIWLEDVEQLVRIEVDEAGTKAAAATSAGGFFGGPPPSKKFTVDQPFLFLIGDNRSESILFIGRVRRPFSGQERP